MGLPRPIKLIKQDITRFWSMVDRRGPNDCWNWTASQDKDGYGRFHDCNNSSYQAHRIAFAVCNGDTKLQVCHNCNNPACCNPSHLYAGSQSKNIQQCYDDGRAFICCGENSGNVKLTESKVLQIRELYRDGWLQREIAEKFGICQVRVSEICRGKAWKHV